MPVETIPVKGDHVYLNGVHFVVESHSYFFQGGIGGPPSPVLVNLLKTEALYEEPAR
jgi:hypothetical protein